MRVLLVESDRSFRGHLCAALAGAGFETSAVDGFDEALDLARGGRFRAVMVGVRGRRREPLDFISKVSKGCPGVKVILINHTGEVPLSIEAMKLGAHDEVPVPVDVDDLARKLRAAQ
ncbi:MAG: response regulator [Desulfovibrionaceae bacterium]|nr:response regulator [Desulfovibrionaceae bacterium]